MTDPNPNTEAGVVAAYATAAAAPTVVDDGRFVIVNHPINGVQVIDLDLERDGNLREPLRKSGTYRVTDAESFITYYGKHAAPSSEVWADPEKYTITAVLDAHGQAPGWEEHRLVLTARRTEAWQAWHGLSGSLVDQAAFAEHIEDRIADIVDPPGATMLELAQSIEATIGVRFESSKLLSSGERQLSYKENVDARAGRSGQLDIPREFTLGIKPFEGSDPYRVKARFRYRLADGNLRLGYKLDRPLDVLREAFGDVITDVSNGADVEILMGVSA